MPSKECIAGTTNTQFQIGRRGPILWQAILPPDLFSFPVAPSDGDLFLQLTISESVWQLRGGSWFRLEDYFSFHRVIPGDIRTIPSTRQMLVHDNVDVGGSITLEDDAELVVL